MDTRRLCSAILVFSWAFTTGVTHAASDLPVTSGLVLHLNASDPNNGGALPANGERPLTWADTSGLGHDAGSRLGAPTWIASGGSTFNYKPVFRFDGNDAYVIGATAGVDPLGVHGAEGATIITVINPRGNLLSADTRWFGHTGGGSDFFGHTYATTPQAGTGTSAGSTYPVYGPDDISAASDRHILASVHSRFLRVIYDNGVAGAVDASDWGAGTTISCPSQKGVGTFENSSSYFYTGDIAEVIVFNRALSSGELSAVQAHLEGKYKAVPPATTLPVTEGLVLHLDASDPLNNGGTSLPGNGTTPANWRDTSGHDTGTTGLVSDPAWVADGGAAWNNKPVFRFDGNDAYRIGEDGNLDPLGLHGVATELTIITVINPKGNAVNNNTRWFGHTSIVALGHQGTADGYGYAAATVTTGGGAISGTGVVSNVSDSHILVSTHARYLRRFYNNGILESSSTSDWGDGTLNTPSPKGVGTFGTTGSTTLGTLYYTGDIAEVIVYDRVPTDWQLNRIGFHLQTKYGISGQYYDSRGSMISIR